MELQQIAQVVMIQIHIDHLVLLHAHALWLCILMMEAIKFAKHAIINGFIEI